MCSFLFTNKEIEDLDYVNRYMGDRGPDITNVVEVGEYSFVHNLLSISGEFTPQPFLNEERQIACVYNGEIYNFKEIKKTLIKHGYKFKSNTDTEVLLKGYSHWGKNIVHRVIGMFSFVIYDHGLNSLFIARDHIGIKPLYYYHNKDKFIFGSTINSILPHNLPRRPNERLMGVSHRNNPKAYINPINTTIINCPRTKLDKT